MANAFQQNAFQPDAFQESLVSGVLYAVDQNDSGSFAGTVAANNVDTHDGFTKEEIKRLKRIQKKIAEAEAKRIALAKAQAKERKQFITDLVDPKPKQTKKNKVQSKQEVTVDIPSIDLTEINRSIAYFEAQQSRLLQIVAHRQELARIQTELAILEAKRQAEMDDEEAILMFL